MKGTRKVFFTFFAVTALISINLMYNMLRRAGGYGMNEVVAVACICVAAQLPGLIFVILNRSRVLMGIFSIVTGFATVLSGSLAFGFLGAPAPQVLSRMTLASMLVSFLLFIGYIVLGLLFFNAKPAKVE